MASDKPFNYHSGLWLLLSHIMLSQTYSRLGNDSIEYSEVDNRLEKIHFDASQLGFSSSHQFKSDGVTSHKHGQAAKYSLIMARSEVASFKTNLFRIAGTSEAETSMKGKT